MYEGNIRDFFDNVRSYLERHYDILIEFYIESYQNHSPTKLLVCQRGSLTFGKSREFIVKDTSALEEDFYEFINKYIEDFNIEYHE